MDEEEEMAELPSRAERERIDREVRREMLWGRMFVAAVVLAIVALVIAIGSMTGSSSQGTDNTLDPEMAYPGLQSDGPCQIPCGP